MLYLFVLGVVGLLTVILKTRRKQPIAPRDDPRWLPPDGRPQIAGRACAMCARRIALSLEGVACETCRAPCHKGCLVEHLRHDHAPDPEAPYR